MKTILFVILLTVTCGYFAHGQSIDTVRIKSKAYLLTPYKNAFYRYEDAKTLEITCGYLNPVDSMFYSCNGTAIVKIKNTTQWQDGSGCCHAVDNDISFAIDSQKHIFFARLSRFRFSKGLIVLKKKDIGKIRIYVTDINQKNRLDSIKTGKEYFFVLGRLYN